MLLAYEEKEQARKAGSLGHSIAAADLGNRSNKATDTIAVTQSDYAGH